MFDEDEGLIKRLKMANFNLIYHLFYKSTPPLKVELILGIVQISHGMIECMSKYEEFANILNQEGFPYG